MLIHNDTAKEYDESALQRERDGIPLSNRLEVGPSRPNLLLDVLLVQSERLLEHACELPNLPLETLLVDPSLPRVQQFRRNTLQRGGDREIEGPEVLVLGLGQFARVDGVNDTAGVLKRASKTGSVLATSPAGVDEPAVDLVPGHAVG